MKCAQILIAVGSNQPGDAGNSLQVCNSTIDQCESLGLRVLDRARWRRTPAFPVGAGPEFVNGALLVETTLEPMAVLACLHDIEAMHGRVRRERWGPRILDLDLVAYGDLITPDEATVRQLMSLGADAQKAPIPDQMILPHPRMHERAFVLAPLADVAPDWVHPLTGRTVSEMLADLPAELRDEVTVLEDEN